MTSESLCLDRLPRLDAEPQAIRAGTAVPEVVDLARFSPEATPAFWRKRKAAAAAAQARHERLHPFDPSESFY